MSMDELKSLVAASVPTDFTDSKRRQQFRDQLRANEWAMHQKLIAAAQTALDHFLSNPHRVTAQDVTKLTELAFELGRSACGFAPGQSDDPQYRGPTISLEFRTAIEKIYGRPVPPQFIDADEIVPVKTPAPTSEGRANPCLFK